MIADGKEGTVLYVYTNGYTLVAFPDVPISGGIFNNDSTFRSDQIRRVLDICSRCDEPYSSHIRSKARLVCRRSFYP